MVTGVLSGGPQNLIATVLSQDLGQHPTLKGNAEALATVIAIVGASVAL